MQIQSKYDYASIIKKEFECISILRSQYFFLMKCISGSDPPPPGVLVDAEINRCFFYFSSIKSIWSEIFLKRPIGVKNNVAQKELLIYDQ